MSLAPSNPQQLFTSIQQTRASSYASGAALTFLAYDSVLSLGDEFQHIWRQRWSGPKVMYIIIRYYSLIFLSLNFWVDKSLALSDKFCETYFRFIVLGSSGVIIPLVNLVYVLRIWSIYNRNHIILAIVAALWICDFVVIWVIDVRQSRRGSVIDFPTSLQWPGCTIGNDTKSDLAAWITAITIATIWLLMTLARFVAIATKGVPEPARRVKVIAHRSYHMSPLLISIVQDGILFYFPIMSMLIVSLIMVIVLDGPLEKVLIPWMPAVYSYAGSHLILNLRVAADSSAWSDTTGTMSLVARRLEFLVTSDSDSTANVSDSFELSNMNRSDAQPSGDV